MGAPSRTERALPTSPSTTRRSRLNSPRTLCLWLLRCGARACWRVTGPWGVRAVLRVAAPAADECCESGDFRGG